MIQEMIEMIATCHFGVEAVLKREVTDLGLTILEVEDGRVTFRGSIRDIGRANIWLRTAERVLIKLGTFPARDFEELFQGTAALELERWIPVKGKFWVAKVASVKSKLYAPSAIQSVMKKAMVERMRKAYGIEYLEESGASYPMRVFIKNDKVCVGLDTTGESLHKRGYRKLVAKAPIAENLAAALIQLTPWHPDRILVDPFCGSGTFPIEAALMAAKAAPGMGRNFTAESWQDVLPEKEWQRIREEARDVADYTVATDIQGYDADEEVIRTARQNARMAGVEHMIHFQRRAMEDLSHPKKYGFIITNPPYGERLMDKAEVAQLYAKLGERFRALDDWSMYLITSYEEAEKQIGRKADKNRKLYNGMIKTYFYQFMGPKPPKRDGSAPRPR